MNDKKILLSIAAVFLLSLFQLAVNANKRRRVRQLPLAVVSAFLAAVGVAAVLNRMDQIASVCRLRAFFTNADILAANLLVLTGVVSLRLILLPIITIACRKRALLEHFSLGLYRYDEEYDEWFLYDRFDSYRKYFFAIICGANLAAALFLGLTWMYGSGSSVWLRIFPCAAIAVLNETFNFINGQTKEEFEHSVMGDAADARRVSGFYKLREVLEQLLPETVLSAHTGCEYAGTQSAADFLKNRRDNGDDMDRMAAEYFEVGERYKTADVDRVQAAFQLIHRHNVVFFDPFYRDLDLYIALPLVRTLVAGNKCVVLCGRSTAAADVKQWLAELLHRYSHMRAMWRVRDLSDREPECEVGVLAFHQIYDKRVIDTNRNFLRRTDLVLMVEPSIMLNTGQIALSILSEEMRADGGDPVFCVCDRYTDGLVDTLSHLLRTEITDVVAPPVPRCTYTGMSWDADGDFHRQQLFDKQTKYLGGGTELAAVAIKNQIPKVTWYSETKVPMKDVRWIAGQYFSTICRYMNQPSQQEKLYEKLEFVPGLWSPEQEKEQFIIVEDEFRNMFNMMRTYLSRGKKQAFVNILSENYLLRDYMRCNRQMFLSDPNAIPSLVPDYARTERNTLLKLLITMALRSVPEEEAAKELRLAGIETQDVFDTLSNLLQKYTFADNSLFTVHGVRRTVDEYTVVSSCAYSITAGEFDKNFSNSLKSAYYILEDEKGGTEYIDTKLFSHVTQTVLPGQFVTYDGKYYIVKYVSPQNGVVLRRASDLFASRKYYRQARRYVLDDADGELVSTKRIGDVEFREFRADVRVDTTGYLEMRDSHDLRTAKLIDLSDDPTSADFTRRYRSKTVLRIKLPDADEKVLFTMCLLLSEVFRSVFPDGWPYLAVVTQSPEGVGGILNYMVYPAEGDLEKGCLYIIEDSDIDLGLLSAVEKNFARLMEIIADFLEWHLEKMREPAAKDPVPVKAAEVEAEEKKRRGLVVKMLDRIRKLFGGKKQEPFKIAGVEQVEQASEQEPAPAQSASEEAVLETEMEQPQPEVSEPPEGDCPLNLTPAEEGNDGGEMPHEAEPSVVLTDRSRPVRPDMEPTRAEQYPEDELMPMADMDPDLVHIDGTDIFDNEGMPEDNDYLEASFVAMGLTPVTMSRYQRECFLKFGFEEIDQRIRADEVYRYLRVRGWCGNALTQARKRESFADTGLDLAAVDHCDFCGIPLTGVSFDRLNDGRTRCNDCSSSAISNLSDFKEIFYRTLGMMESFFAIRYRVPISVRMTDARTVAKGTGMVFKPSTQMAVRVLGFAQRKRGKFSMVLENGSPRLATILTMSHELIHIWQYLNWQDRQVSAFYGMAEPVCSAFAEDILYEGMAVWASIQYLYQIGETYFAAQQEAISAAREDVYGIGFRLYMEQYPLVRDSALLKYSPFQSFPPLEPETVKAQVRVHCGQSPCKC